VVVKNLKTKIERIDIKGILFKYPFIMSMIANLIAKI